MILFLIAPRVSAFAGCDKGRVDGLVEEVEEVENHRAELMDEPVIKIVKEVTEVTGQIVALMKSSTSSWSSLNNCKTFFLLSSLKLVPRLVTPENIRIERYIHGIALYVHGMAAETEPTTIQSDILKAGVLTDEAIRNGSLKKNTEKRGNGGEPSRDENVKDDKKRSRTGRAFATTTTPSRKEYTGSAPKCTNCNFHDNPKTPCRMCMNCNRFIHFAKDYRAGPRMVNPLNARNPTAARGACFKCGGSDHYKAACPKLNRAPGQGGTRLNQALAIDGGQGRGNNGNQACERACMLGAEEAHQDPNIMTGTFTLNNHYATTLFDFGADYSFVSTTFIPLLDIEPSNLGFSYEIKIASRQLVEINKVIRGCKLEIEGHTFDIDLISFGHGSFDVIVRMD
ncbi:putative reverse transcriptase domain-containing protein [Tanacetum coccineum]